MQEETNETKPFLANAVHELRTPIQTIIGTLELLSDTKLDQEQTEYVRQVKFSADVLLSLANDLLDFSKIRSGKFKIENIAVNPGNIVETTVDLISIEAHNRGLEIVTDIDYSLPSSIWGDRVRIQQVLLNLVKNAVKFTSVGYVCIKVTSTPKHKYVRFEVIDSGIGVPDDKKDLIFKDFCQADASTTRKYGGTGLGLSISLNLVKLMKGHIGIKDNPEGGSIFWFELPLSICHEAPETDTPQLVLDIPESSRILIVDDHPLALKSLKAKLLNLGAKNIDIAFNGEKALSLMKLASEENKPYTIALIDMKMPIMDGWRLAAEINADRMINSTRLYLMVPEGQMGSEAKMRMLDWFNGYLYKPIKRNALISTLNDGCNEVLDLEIAEGDALSGLDITVKKGIPIIQEKQEKIDSNTYPSPILIAEDHPVNRKLLRTFLEQFGAKVHSAEDGNQAVECINEHPEIMLIFMDIQMPEKNGVEATVELRNKGYQGIIIACTANSDEDDFDSYKKSGMNDVLVKPFKKQSIKTLLDKWITVIAFPKPEESLIEELVPVDSVPEPEEIITELWDYRDMIDTVSGDFSLGIQLLEQFTSQTRTFLISAKEALYVKNFQSIARIAHTLKGSAAAISAKKLVIAAKKIELAAKEEIESDTVDYLNEFSADFSRFEFISKDQINEWKKVK